MAIEIIKADNDCVYVNDKEVRRDSNGNWVASLELTNSEKIAFNDYRAKYVL